MSEKFKPRTAKYTFLLCAEEKCMWNHIYYNSIGCDGCIMLTSLDYCKGVETVEDHEKEGYKQGIDEIKELQYKYGIRDDNGYIK